MATSKPICNDPQPGNKSSRLRTDTLAASVIILLIATVVQRTIGFGRGVLFCRWLSPETLGQWEMAYSFLLLAAPLAVLGVPGSFGRYLEHFRQRGHLRTFLRRTTLWTIVFGTVAVAIVVLNAPQFSQLMFGTLENAGIIRSIALCLAAIIIHHTLTSTLTALRLFRVVSIMNFIQSLLFAGLALGLLAIDTSVTSIVTGYGMACLLASFGTILWIRPGLKDIPQPTDSLPQNDFWPKLLRFAFFVWVTNLLSHLFTIIDRYMIVHHSGMVSAEALEQVGHYHSSRLVPLLLVSVADLLGGMMMPHLSHDWEAGRREQVGTQLNLFIKLSGLTMVSFGVCVLLFAPLLFNIVFDGKYADGLAVLPWTLAGCIWYSFYLISRNYLWCAEKSRLATLPLAIGLGLNILLNLILLPLWGLFGAVVATAVSTLACVAAIVWLSVQHGMFHDRGTWFFVLSPLLLTAGTPSAVAALLVLLVATFGTTLVLNTNERAQLRTMTIHLLSKFRPWLPQKPRPASLS